MEGRLILWVVILSVIVRTEFSYGGKVKVVCGGNIGIVRTEYSYEKESNFTTGFWKEV
jgi:hypothetical protein